MTTSQPGPNDSLLDACPPQVNQKLWHRLYEPLILLSAYGKSQGKHIKSDETSSEGHLDGGNTTLRKKFLDGLAYICDYSPRGDTVAAIAIQDGPQLIYWVAANTNQGSKVKPLLSDILQLLSQVYGASEERVSTLKLQISDRAMVFSARRLQYYRTMLRDTIKTCIPILEKQNTEGANDLKEWLISLSNSELDSISFCRLCYEARDSDFLEVLKQKAKESNIHEGDSYMARYARIRHFIGRLGSHMKAARVLVEAGKHYPRLFTDYSIETATHHLNFAPPSYRNKSSINGIINRMVTDPQACEYYRNELRSQDEKFHLMLEQRIRDEYKNPKFKLRVHAEIILLDLFHCKNLRFLDGVRYIGVSKPSCFLCYRYFQAHPLQARTSGCSNNLYLQWQPPYVQQDSPALVKEQEDILNTMIKGIRLFVLDNIVPDYRGFKAHPDSTTGLTDMHSGKLE
ncbi:MAG: hypothetical protein M1839_001917 [Geoglossum umbratile]|nr:MAG: hypothetical protein M1839_001917 [Geoglossum umbratile]